MQQFLDAGVCPDFGESSGGGSTPYLKEKLQYLLKQAQKLVQVDALEILCNTL